MFAAKLCKVAQMLLTNIHRKLGDGVCISCLASLSKNAVISCQFLLHTSPVTFQILT